MTAPASIANQRFGSLVAKTRVASDKRGKAKWHCLCDCGGTVDARIDNLIFGRTTRCAACRPKRQPGAPITRIGGKPISMPGKPNLSEQIGISESVNTLSDDGDIWGG